MKKIILGLLVALFGGDILLGNITHSSFGLMTVVGAVFFIGGVISIVQGFRQRGSKSPNT